jgi:hypothetical protein
MPWQLAGHFAFLEYGRIQWNTIGKKLGVKEDSRMYVFNPPKIILIGSAHCLRSECKSRAMGEMDFHSCLQLSSVFSRNNSLIARNILKKDGCCGSPGQESLKNSN